jgi:WASH complex subunit CCDC53
MTDLKELQRQQLDYEKAKPLNSNRLVTFVNHFIVSIVEQLNELSSCVDSRLHSINNKINICHSNLVILEMKLNSISGLSLPLNPNNNNTNSLPQTQQIDEIQDNNRPTDVVIETETETSNEVEESEQIDEPKEEEVVEEDPQMAKYRKMLQLGIPLGAVHQKMMTEGVDINLLKV